jgi:hypothetical protein
MIGTRSTRNLFETDMLEIVDKMICQYCGLVLSIEYVDKYDDYYSIMNESMHLLADGEIRCQYCVKKCDESSCNDIICHEKKYCDKCYIELTIKNTYNDITKTLPVELVTMILTFC